MELIRGSTSIRLTPHGRIDRRDSRNFGWRSTCGSLGMGKFFRARIGGCNIGRDPSNHLFRTVLGVHYEFLPRVYSTELVEDYCKLEQQAPF